MPQCCYSVVSNELYKSSQLWRDVHAMEWCSGYECAVSTFGIQGQLMKLDPALLHAD